MRDSIIYLTQPTLRLGRAALKHRFTWSCNLSVAHLCESLRTMVVSYTAFSPLPAYSGGYFLLPYHTLTHICSFNRHNALCCPDFPPPFGSDRTTYCATKIQVLLFCVPFPWIFFSGILFEKSPFAVGMLAIKAFFLRLLRGSFPHGCFAQLGW